MQIFIGRPTLILTGSFGLLDTLGLALAALLVILAGNGGHHLHQHRVDRAQHPPSELITFDVLHSLVARWKVERDDAQPFAVNHLLELLPVLHGEACEAIY
ncbi:hypothetical protein D3C80_1839490 [compost metagenome]